MNGQELYHYGVPGMRWGVRNSNNARVVNRGSISKLKKHNNMVEKLRKSGELNKDGEKYEIDYDRSKHIKSPKSTPKSTPKSDLATQVTVKKSKDDSVKKPVKEDKTKKSVKEDKNKKTDKEQPKDPTADKKAKLQESIDNLNATKNVLDASSKGLNAASNIAANKAREARSQPSEKVKKELSEMDDKQLQQRINRIRMEREYTELNPSEKAQAAERTSRVLNNIGSLVAIGGSIATIALTIQQLRAKRS